jgi:predicted ATPase
MGFGKTALIEELAKSKEFCRSPEIASELIKEQLEIGGKLIPWIDRYAFEKELLKRRIDAYLSTSQDRICFFDRGIPEAIAFFRSEEKDIPVIFLEASQDYRYSDKVFLLPPWEEIYHTTHTRPQSFEESARLSSLLEELYLELGYDLIIVPKDTIENRVKFIIKHIDFIT